MPSFPINSFKFGLDTRRDVLTSLPGTLVTCENCHINPGGEVEKRKEFGDFVANTEVLDSNGAQGTFGLEVTDAGLVVFGSALNFGASVTQSQPTLASALTGVTYQQLKHPSLTNDSTESYNASYHRMTAIVFSENFNGKAFACATFSDGRRFLYYDGSLVQHSANGIVMEGRTALADLSNDLVRQVETVNWVGLANRTEVTLTSITNVTTTATAAYTGHGLSNGDIVEVREATPVQYNGRFVIFGVVANVSFKYTMSSDPLASATGGIATIYQAGATLIDSRPGDSFDAVPSETAASGQLGVKLEATTQAGVSGEGSVACFEITANAGTFVVEAPENSDGTGTVNLCGETILARSTATTTATAIVKAINDLTFVHGYAATSDVGKIFVSVDREWGPVTFNLTVTVAGGAAVGTCTGVGALSIIEILNAGTYDEGPATSGFYFTTTEPLEVVKVGGVAPFTYAWSECSLGSANTGVATNPTRDTTNFTFDLRNRGQRPQTFAGVFKCTVRDSAGGEASLCALKGV